MLYTSKEYLHSSIDIDPEIAAFFVDRKVPVNNMYWKDRYLYISKGKGFLFIPLYFDLMYRAGLSKEQILNEDFVRLTEDILHSAALHEAEKIDLNEHVKNCRNLLDGKIRNHTLFRDLSEFFSRQAVAYEYLGTFSSALNRGDTYLYALCSLSLPAEQTSMAIKLWYALVPTFLLMDDVVDLNEDRRKGEENSINDFGSGTEGLLSALCFLRENFSKLKRFNQKLGDWLERSLEKMMTTPYMTSLLNE